MFEEENDTVYIMCNSILWSLRTDKLIYSDGNDYLWWGDWLAKGMRETSGKNIYFVISRALISCSQASFAVMGAPIKTPT